MSATSSNISNDQADADVQITEIHRIMDKAMSASSKLVEMLSFYADTGNAMTDSDSYTLAVLLHTTATIESLFRGFSKEHHTN